MPVVRMGGWGAAALAAGTAALAAPAAAQVLDGRPIAEVEVRGCKNTPVEVVRLAAAAAGIKEGQPFSNDAFNRAKEALRQRGLYALLSGRTEVTADKRIRVIFEVFENPIVTSIRITGNRSLRTDELPRLSIEPGKVLNRVTLAEDIVKIQRFYASKGYRATVADELEVDPRTGVLTIPLTESVVEKIQLQGLTKTKPDVIRREMRTREGDPYNENLIQQDLSRLLALGIFQDVATLQPEPGSELGKVALTVVVQEQRTGQVGVSFGYDVRQRLTGTLSLTEQNFRGRAEGLSVEWTVAGGLARNSYQFSFSEPWIDKNNTSLGVSFYDQFAFRFNRIFSSNLTAGISDNQYFEQRRGATLRLSRPLTPDRFTRAFSSLRTEAVRANNLQANYDTLTDDEIRNLRGSLVQRGDVVAVSLGVTANPVDNAQDPSRGYFVQPSIEIGRSTFDFQKPRLNPDYISATETPNVPRVLVENRAQRGPFAKYNLDLRRYISLNGPRSANNLREPKRVLALRMLAGSASGSISFSEQYFVGGADTLRGYYDDRFWGNNQLLLSSELRVPFDKQGQLGGVAFLDAGDAWGATDVNGENIPGFDQHRRMRLNLGYGFGIRVRTPVGAVRLDYGFGRDGRGKSHFSIGQAF